MPRFPPPPRPMNSVNHPILRGSTTSSKVSHVSEDDNRSMTRVSERTMSSRACDLRSLGDISNEGRYIARLQEKIEAQRKRRMRAEQLLNEPNLQN